jgi:hypothetical protein
LSLKNVVVIHHNYNPVSEKINWGFLDKIAHYCENYNRLKAFHYSARYDKFWFLFNPEFVKDTYKPSILISHTNYHPGFNKNVIPFFREFDCPKVWVCIDAPFKYGYEPYAQYVRDCGFNLVIQRGYIKKDRYSVWLPYSVDTTDFYDENSARIHKVGFAGSVRHNNYNQRRRILDTLDEAKLLYHESDWRILGKGYARFLRCVKVGLTCAEFGTARAKMYEYMASGTCVLTQKFKEKRKLFSKRCWWEYKDEGNVVEKARQLLKDKYTLEHLAKTAREQIEKYHTDAIRINQFYITIKHLIEGKSLPRFFRR